MTNQEKPQETSRVDEAWDKATQERLAKLRDRPLDMGGLEAKLHTGIPPAPIQNPQPARQTGRFTWTRSLRALAASFILVAILVGLFLSLSGGPAVASVNEMAQMHDDVVAKRIPVMQVDSIEAAEKALANQWPQSPGLPDAPNEHVMACCMKSVKGKRVACVLLDQNGTPVTMTVANATDMRVPDSPTVVRGGETYHVQTVKDLSMVMTERNGRWVCLISRLPADSLIDTAHKLQF